MNTWTLLPLLALAIAGAPAAAHENHAKPAADAASVAPLAKPKRDPQAYFSDRELYTQDGRKMRFYSDVLKGRTVVINTIYTNCQDACPLITAQMNQVRAKLGDSFGKDIHFVSISTDPARDSPQAMKKYAAAQSADVPGWLFLTGKQADIEFILKRLGQWSQTVESHATHLVAWNFVADRGRKMLPNLPPEMLAAQLVMVAGGEALVPLPAPAKAP
jgi:cytochrome oxidase Cu insertion factor (SCO1/SenC/PrrC family)